MAEYDDVIKELDVLSCCLIGEYNDQGEYVIEEDLKKSLVECTKLITSYNLEGMDCQAQIGEHTAIMHVKFAFEQERSIKVAGLFLVETYKFLGKKYTVETFLAQYSDFDDQYFLNKFREAFNLVTKDESEGKDIKNSIPKFEEIKAEKKSQYKKMIEGLLDFNKRYVMEVLGLLKTSGGLGAEIRQQLKIRLTKIKAAKNTPQYWAEVKNELDILIAENKEKYEEETKKLLEEINRRYMTMYKKVAKEVAQKKAKEAAKKKKKSSAKEADDYKPYYPTVTKFQIDFKPITNSFKFEFEKPQQKIAPKPPPIINRQTEQPRPNRPENPTVTSSNFKDYATQISMEVNRDFISGGNSDFLASSLDASADLAGEFTAEPPAPSLDSGKTGSDDERIA